MLASGGATDEEAKNRGARLQHEGCRLGRQCHKEVRPYMFSSTCVWTYTGIIQAQQECTLNSLHQLSLDPGIYTFMVQGRRSCLCTAPGPILLVVGAEVRCVRVQQDGHDAASQVSDGGAGGGAHRGAHALSRLLVLLALAPLKPYGYIIGYTIGYTIGFTISYTIRNVLTLRSLHCAARRQGWCGRSWCRPVYSLSPSAIGAR
eukprot:9389313-Pyramimonas_sp.AAC.4